MIDQYDEEFATNHLMQVVRAHSMLMEQPNPQLSLSFAWEAGHSDFLRAVTSDIAETEILVIIGYSFPFFNRGVDRLILGALNKLKKVYIQSPEASNIQTRFKATRPDEVPFLLSSDIDQFLIPNEMKL